MDDLPNIEARISVGGPSKTATSITSIRARTSWTAPLSAEACTWVATLTRSTMRVQRRIVEQRHSLFHWLQRVVTLSNLARKSKASRGLCRRPFRRHHAHGRGKRSVLEALHHGHGVRPHCEFPKRPFAELIKTQWTRGNPHGSARSTPPPCRTANTAFDAQQRPFKGRCLVEFALFTLSGYWPTGK